MVECKIGDRILFHPTKGPTKLLADFTAWWNNSNWSHIVPVLAENEILDVSWPSPKIRPLADILDGSYRVKVLRPKYKTNAGPWALTGVKIMLEQHELLTKIGFISEEPPCKGIRRLSGAEAVLLMDQASGALRNCNGKHVSPQTFDDFATAGLYTVVWES